MNSMKLPKRVVLSRKGFDSSAGGFASPIFSDGQMVSLPIPENRSHKNVTYSFNDLRKPTGRDFSISEILKRLHPSFDSSQKVHLDPDIRPSLRPKNTHDPLGYFGQDDTSMKELQNNGVCDPDNQSLFLFYGWYKGVGMSNDGNLYYERAQKDELRTHHQHMIWGWLQSEGYPRRIPESGLSQELKQFAHHPHIEERNRKNNYIFVSKKKLSFADDIPGVGVFSHYDLSLRLTCSKELNKRSSWLVPAFLHPCARGRIEKALWSPEGKNMRVEYRGYGQEFIFDTVGFEAETSEWLGRIFQCVGTRNSA